MSKKLLENEKKTVERLTAGSVNQLGPFVQVLYMLLGASGAPMHPTECISWMQHGHTTRCMIFFFRIEGIPISIKRNGNT